MINAQELKEKLTNEMIHELIINYLNADISYEDDEKWISNTICHHESEGSQKLYFFKDTQLFCCYTECGSMDIIDLVIHHFNWNESDIIKSIDWICNKLKIDKYETGFGIKNKIISMPDWTFINKYKKKLKKSTAKEDLILKEYDDNLLNMFQDVYYQGWIDEGISVKTMQKYNIKYSTWQQKIIIPHYDINNRLIGIRGRALLEQDIECFGKYTPFRLSKDNFCSHSLGKNLYGLSNNINAIKRKRKIMLVESEKSVMQADTMFGDNNFTSAVSGNNLTKYQLKILLGLGIREVIIGLDKQYEIEHSNEYSEWAKHIKDKFITPLSPYFVVTVLWDRRNYLNYKDSPTDRGKEILLKLMNEKIYVGTS